MSARCRSRSGRGMPRQSICRVFGRRWRREVADVGDFARIAHFGGKFGQKVVGAWGLCVAACVCGAEVVTGFGYGLAAVAAFVEDVHADGEKIDFRGESMA